VDRACGSACSGSESKPSEGRGDGQWIHEDVLPFLKVSGLEECSSGDHGLAVRAKESFAGSMASPVREIPLLVSMLFG
jgi:hypothetical protein